MRLPVPALCVLLAIQVAAAETSPQEDAFADVHLSWGQLQELGGIALGEPFRDRTRKWVLAVDCNVAGARTVQVPPTRSAPSQGVRRVSAQVAPGRIDLWVLAAEPRNGAPDPECRGAFLGYPTPGRYQVFYREPEGEQRRIGTAIVPDYKLEVPGRPRR